jgi:hypothetical protein
LSTEPPREWPEPFPRPETPPPPAYGSWGYGWPAPPQPPPSAPWGRPAGPSVAWAVVLWIVAVGGLIGALMFGVLAATGFWFDNQMDTHGVTTTATVTDVNLFADTYTVQFTTEDDRLVTAEIIWPSETPAVGDQVEITYAAEDPTYATEAGSPEDLIMGAVFSLAAAFALAAAVGAVIGAVLVHRARGRARRQAPMW